MIVEKRSQIRKSYVNYAGTPATAGNTSLSALDIAVNKSEPKRKRITHQPIDNALNFSSAADWDDESVLETSTTSSLAVYVYAFITVVAYFAIGCYMFAG